MVKVKVYLTLKGLTKFMRDLDTNTPTMIRILKLWGVRYRSFVQERFDLYSKGGGNWKPLAPATIARRRKGTGTGDVAILRDTGTLFRALNPILGMPGSFEEIQPWAVVLGFGGASMHPSGRATIADIASFHNSGTARLPKRQIIVKPTADLLEEMGYDAAKILTQQLRDDTK